MLEQSKLKAKKQQEKADFEEFKRRTEQQAVMKFIHCGNEDEL